MLWSVDSCQKSVSSDHFRLTVSRAQVSTHWVRVLFWIYPVTNYYLLNDRRLKFIFFKCMLNKLCSWAVPLRFWFETDLGRQNSAGFYMQSLLTFLTMVTCWSRSSSNFYALICQKLTGEFMRKMYAASGTCFLIAEADRVLYRQLFMFLTVFFHWNYKWRQLLSRFFCNSWLVCLLEKCLGNAPLVKIIGNPISYGIVFVFHLAWCVRGLKRLKWFWPYLMAFRSCISTDKPE